MQAEPSSQHGGSDTVDAWTVLKGPVTSLVQRLHPVAWAASLSPNNGQDAAGNKALPSGTICYMGKDVVCTTTGHQVCPLRTL